MYIYVYRYVNIFDDTPQQECLFYVCPESILYRDTARTYTHTPQHECLFYVRVCMCAMNVLETICIFVSSRSVRENVCVP